MQDVLLVKQTHVNTLPTHVVQVSSASEALDYLLAKKPSHIVLDEQEAQQVLDEFLATAAIPFVVVAKGRLTKLRHWSAQGASDVWEESEWLERLENLVNHQTGYAAPEETPKENTDVAGTSYLEAAANQTNAETIPNSLATRTIVLFSHKATGKTFVGINLSIALGRKGLRVLYTDLTPDSTSKNWFNAPDFPIRLAIPVTISDSLQEPGVYDVQLIEASDATSIPPDAEVVLVVDSDIARQIALAKAARSLRAIGMVWNQEVSGMNPTTILSLPIITSIVRYQDTLDRIRKGTPRALDDEHLCEELYRIYSFDPLKKLMENGL